MQSFGLGGINMQGKYYGNVETKGRKEVTVSSRQLQRW